MTADEAIKILKEQFIHSAVGKVALDVVEKELKRLKYENDRWEAAVDRAWQRGDYNDPGSR